ncbi:MAG: NUDIX domain-containing protein [Oscillospiraceae bacterium]|jgi:8-oxo-dGTP diphosphatase|nr:NUDIX domain-containing protein [Oscillospiraceae bacterium]
MNGVTVFFPPEEPDVLQFAVVAARYGGKWLFVRHRERDTFELPGGHIEPGETPENAARRELFEESGALEFNLAFVSWYGVERGGVRTCGALFYAEVTKFGELPTDFEMAERAFFAEQPPGVTYPAIQPKLLEKTRAWIARKK